MVTCRPRTGGEVRAARAARARGMLQIFPARKNRFLTEFHFAHRLAPQNHPLCPAKSSLLPCVLMRPPSSLSHGAPNAGTSSAHYRPNAHTPSRHPSFGILQLKFRLKFRPGRGPSTRAHDGLLEAHPTKPSYPRRRAPHFRDHTRATATRVHDGCDGLPHSPLVSAPPFLPLTHRLHPPSQN